MLGLNDCVTKDARIFCVLDNNRKYNLLPIVKGKVNTNDNEEEVIE